MSILSLPVAADTLARVFAGAVNPAPKAAVRFAEIPGRSSQATIPTRYGPVAATLYHSVNHLYTERDRFRDPVCARAARNTYRTFLVREIPGGARNPETRRATVPIRALFGTGDAAIHTSLVAPETANADDYTLETVDASHFVLDERPDLVRAKLIAVLRGDVP